MCDPILPTRYVGRRPRGRRPPGPAIGDGRGAEPDSLRRSEGGSWGRCTAPPRRELDPAAFQERLQLAAAARGAELPERLRLDLTDALARHLEALAHLLESVLGAVADPEAHLDHALLARGERLQERVGLLLEVEVDHVLGGRHRGAVLDEVPEMRVLFLPDRRLERDRLL